MSRRNRVRLSVVAVFLLGYFVLFWGVGCSDYMILHPSVNPIEVRDARRLMLTYETGPGGEKKLEYWVGQTKVRKTQENLAYVLEMSPNAGRAEYSLMYGIGKWEGLPIEYWAVNYPGYGGSEGECTLENVHRTALAAYDEVAKVAGGKPIFLSGYSLGTTAALYVAANRPVAGLYLYNPPPLRQLITGKWWYLFPLSYPIARGVPKQLDSIANGNKSSAPAFFALGENDTFVDYKYQKRVAEAYAGVKRVVPMKVTHDDDPEVLYRREIREGILWLWEKGVTGPAGVNAVPVAPGLTSPTTQPGSTTLP